MSNRFFFLSPVERIIIISENTVSFQCIYLVITTNYICSTFYPHGWANGWQDLNRKLRLHGNTWWIQVGSWFSHTGTVPSLNPLEILDINLSLPSYWGTGHYERVLDCVRRHRQGTHWCAVNLTTFIGRFKLLLNWARRGEIGLCLLIVWPYYNAIASAC
jgi:hypothetical protein